MKYETFIAELKTLGFDIPVAPPKPKRQSYGYNHTIKGLPYGGLILYNSMHHSEECDCEPALVLSWCTGGVTGGSCWGGENHGYSSGEVEPDWEDRILEHFCPNITHLKYKAVMRNTRSAHSHPWLPLGALCERLLQQGRTNVKVVMLYDGAPIRAVDIIQRKFDAST